MGRQRLIDMGFTGYGGWGDVEAEADFRATGGSGKGPSQPSAPSTSNFQMPDFEGIARRQEEARLAKEAQTRTQEEGFLGRFRGFIGGQEGLPIMAERIGKELGLPNLRETAFKAGQTLRDVGSTFREIPQAITATGRAASVNADRLTRAIAQRAAELRPVLETATRGVEEAFAGQQFGERELGERLGYGVKQQEKELLPFTTEATMMSDRVAREVTGFNQGQQRELDAILKRMEQGVTLQKAEYDRATQLAVKESEFENKKKELELTNRLAPSTEVVTVGGRKKLINKSTGQVISDLGSSSEGSGTNVLKYLQPTSTTGSTTGTSNFNWSNYGLG